MMPNAETDRVISFKEFLASQEDRLRAERIAQDRAKDRWINSVVGLIEQIERWIKDSDPHGLVEFEHLFGDLASPPTNAYVRAQLDIWVGNQKVSIRPVAIQRAGAALEARHGPVGRPGRHGQRISWSPTLPLPP